MKASLSYTRRFLKPTKICKGRQNGQNGLKYRSTDQFWHYVKCHRAHDKARHNVHSQKSTHKSKSLTLLLQLIVLLVATLFMRQFYQHLISELKKNLGRQKVGIQSLINNTLGCQYLPIK